MSGVGDRYRFEYAPGTPYSHAVGLVDRTRAPGGEVVVDLGCGFGAIAEPVRDLGLTYLGVDLEESGLRSLSARGFEVLSGDVCEPTALLDALDRSLGGRRLAALTALDCLEHLPNAVDVLAALAAYAARDGEVPLVVSIPNVSHRDVGAKLLLGRWDVTPTGLLDATHVRFFAPSTLAETMEGTGWAEVEADDFAREESDQHFPAGCPALLSTTPVGALLRRIRAAAAPGGDITNQFVRAYRPGGAGWGGGGSRGGTRTPDAETDATPDAPDARDAPDASTEGNSGDGAVPFLSVLVAVACPGSAETDEALDTLLGSLAEQRSSDFEVVLVTAESAGTDDGDGAGSWEQSLTRNYPELEGRLRVAWPDDTAAGSGATGSGATGSWGTALNGHAVALARGRYVAALRPGEEAAPDWVAELAETAAPGPGRVLDAGRARGAHLLAVLADDPGPLSAFAFPRSVFADLGLSFGRDALDESRLVVQAVELCGLSPTPSRDLVGRPAGAAALGAGDGEADDEGGAGRAPPRAAMLAALDGDPLLFDRGAATLLVGLHDERDGLLDVRDQLQAELAAMHASTSWRVTAPLRALTRWLRHR